MVIDANNIGPTGANRSARNGSDSVDADSRASVDKTQAESRPVSQDTVEISAAAQEFDRIRQSLDNLPEVDESKVARIQQQIADGSYSVDAEQLAESILRDDQNFLV